MKMAGEETEFNLDPEADQDQSEFPYFNGRLPEQRKRLTISVELVALSLIFMDEPTSGMQGLPPLLFLGHHIFKSVDEATEGVPDGHYPATWKLDVTIFSRKSKMSFALLKYSTT
ncbi:hypothetical protein F2Q69_00014797 [Brassica cretica]|uniref:Uncharacterized protein n=1 Tax=Brassica cretica TaxID=69181 RepID=A0A8S9QQ82_BRACR|nr:hypothetical protein F2Q69_00014797 [Brassica cretica]